MIIMSTNEPDRCIRLKSDDGILSITKDVAEQWLESITEQLANLDKRVASVMVYTNDDGDQYAIARASDTTFRAKTMHGMFYLALVGTYDVFEITDLPKEVVSALGIYIDGTGTERYLMVDPACTLESNEICAFEQPDGDGDDI